MFIGISLFNLFNLLYNLFMVRYLPPVDFGQLNTLLALFMVISVPANTVQTAITRFVSPLQAKGEYDRIKGLLRHFLIVMFIGDSMLAGIGLTQKETLSEVLERRLDVSVYPYAPRRVSDFLKESRFFHNPPDIIIFETAETQISLLTPLSLRQKNLKEEGSVIEFFRQARLVPWVQSLGIFLDRIYKANLLNYLRAQLRRKVSIMKPQYHDRSGSMLFLMGTTVNKDVPEEQILAHAQMIEDYCRTVEKRGIRFIFLPIPTKENIYHDLLPDPKRPVYLDHLILELKKRGVETVNLQPAFNRAYHKNSALLYWPDDTHWNAKGVRIAADLIEQMLKKERLF
jgi:alginate O-acetyltransferase complex protein AlgJ